MNFLNETLLKEVAQILKENRLTIAVAESCTSGLLQNAFSQAKEAMSFFQGGLTVYNIGQKSKQLGINPIFAEDCNSVSKDIAEQMALAVAGKFNAETGLAITGYAQPVPHEGVASCFAYVAVSKNSKIILSKKITGDAEKNLWENQQIYTDKILSELKKVLKK